MNDGNEETPIPALAEDGFLHGMVLLLFAQIVIREFLSSERAKEILLEMVPKEPNPRDFIKR